MSAQEHSRAVTPRGCQGSSHWLGTASRREAKGPMAPVCPRACPKEGVLLLTKDRGLLRSSLLPTKAAHRKCSPTLLAKGQHPP